MRVSLTHHCTILDSDLETPVGMFIRLAGDSQGILFESAEVDGRWGRYSIIACDFLLAASCLNGELALTFGDDRIAGLAAHAGKPFLQGVRDLMESVHLEADGGTPQPPITRALYGYIGYGVAGLMEPKLAACLPPEEAEACLVLPGTLIVFDHGYNRITRIDVRLNGETLAALPMPAPAGGNGTIDLGPLATREGYTDAVSRVKTMLHQGEAIQVVLSTPRCTPLSESPFSLYRRLRRLNPSSYMFYMRLPDGILIGSSPEVMVSCSQNRLRLCPIAGTRPRSSDLEQDILFGDELMQDPKEKAEHVMLVDLGRNDLGRIAKAGSVVLERLMEVERFSHVMHLSSRIGADLAPDLDAVDVLSATFPAGTVSGAPKVRAMEIIADCEQRPRGPYAGAVGWMGLDKDAVNLDFGIIIRSLWIRGGQVYWQTGAGIVHDSDPDKEWQECRNKAEAIRKTVLG